jgi:hypothetical protein
MNRMNQTNDIVGQHLQQDFVDLILSVANLNSGGNRGLKQAMAVPLPGI